MTEVASDPVTHPREEVQLAFQEFLRRGVERHDWEGWADLFTDDAEYVEHNLGRFHGRDEIKAWITSTMADYRAMTLDMEWSMIEEPSSSVRAATSNRDGS